MKKNVLLPVVVLTVFSGLGWSSNLSAVHADEQAAQTVNQQKAQQEVIQFEDSNIETMAKIELSMILGRPVSAEDMTQENLNKITEIVTLAGSNITTLNDLSKMPNLELVQISASTGSKVLDTSALANLTNLKEFTFWFADGQLTSLEPLVGKPLERLTLRMASLLDDSEKEINTMSQLETIDINYFSNDKSVTMGSLDNLPQLKEITLGSMGLTSAPTLSASTQLEYANFSDNGLTELPNLTKSNHLWYLDISRNKITDYTNVDNVLALSSEPTVDLSQNLLTTYHEVSNQRKLRLDGNFILGHDLSYQNAIKLIGIQNFQPGEQKEIPIKWVDEQQYPLNYDFTSYQKEFTDLKNMTITTDNQNVTIEKTDSSIIVKAKNGVTGSTHVVLSYQGELKTEFDVIVK